MGHTCNKVFAILCDVHAIDGPRQRAFQFSNGRAVIHVPVGNLRGKLTHYTYLFITGIVYGRLSQCSRGRESVHVLYTDIVESLFFIDTENKKQAS